MWSGGAGSQTAFTKKVSFAPRSRERGLARITLLCLCSLFAVTTPARPTLAAASARLSLSALNFGSQVLGTPSASQAITLRNSGAATLNVTSLTASGDFSQTNTCAGSLTGNSSCTISVTFTPTAKGSRRGSITISDNATDSPQVVYLSGDGTVVKLSVDTLNFEGQPVRTSSNPRVVTLTNIGNTPLKITEIRIAVPVEVWGSPRGSDVRSFRRGGEYMQTNDCGTSVAQGASCTIQVTFTPRKARSSEEWLTISDDGGGSPQRVSLFGIGLR